MKDTNLFQQRDGSWITTSHLSQLLEEVKAPDAKVLYMHTGMTFGSPDPKLPRKELLRVLYDVIASLGVPTLCVPTFTFSFCNGVDYSVEGSRTRMGALNEFIRELPETVRSVDPLMSCALRGKDLDLVTNLGKNSIGEDSTFDKLHHRGSDVRFLFLGTTVSECFTYTHYVEERLGAPYRYNRAFSGRITQGGQTWHDTYNLFVRYKDVVPSASGMLESELIRRGLLRKEVCGQSSVACVSEPDGYDTIVDHLQQHSYCYIERDPGDRNQEFVVRDMVSL